MSMPAERPMVTIKRPDEIARMRQAGLILVDTLDILKAELRPGITSAERPAFPRVDLREHQ
jgi:methionine aminopeptidase